MNEAKLTNLIIIIIYLSNWQLQLQSKIMLHVT